HRRPGAPRGAGVQPRAGAARPLNPAGRHTPAGPDTRLAWVEHVLVSHLTEVPVVVVHDKLFSGTRWADPITTGVLEVTSPATGAVVGRVAETTVEDLTRWWVRPAIRSSRASGGTRLPPSAAHCWAAWPTCSRSGRPRSARSCPTRWARPPRPRR